MPSPLKRMSLVCLLSSLCSSTSRASSFPVRTGFPTSLADLVVTNHGRLSKPRKLMALGGVVVLALLVVWGEGMVMALTVAALSLLAKALLNLCGPRLRLADSGGGGSAQA